MSANQEGDGKPTKSRVNYRVDHRPPSAVKWGKEVWFEAMVSPPIDQLQVMLRIGRQAGYKVVDLKAGKDGYWSGSYRLGAPKPSIEVVQYYVVGTKDNDRTMLLHSPAAPQSLTIETAPRSARTNTVSHEWVARWNENEALPISAQIDEQFTNPMVHYRIAGSARFERVAMKKYPDQLFSAEIPANSVVRPHIYYYLSALNPEAKRVSVKGTAARPLRVKVMRQRLLDGTLQRNRAQVRFDWVDRGVEGDGSQRKDMLYERAFFPFLVARIGFLLWDEDRLAAQVIGGQAGVELRFREFLSLTGDAHTLAFGQGSAFGYRLGLQIGDEAGASIGGSYGYAFDLETSTHVGESLSFRLQVPVAERYQLSGVFESDDFFADEKDLRLYTRFAARLGKHAQVSGSAGMATRGGQQSGLYFGASVGVGF